MKSPDRAGLPPALAVFVLLCAIAPHARGQTLSDTTVVPIEGVTVAGSRVPESVLKSPAAVTVVPEHRLETVRKISLGEGLTRVPGVFSQSRGGAQDVRITIRGYGARGNGERSNSGNMRGIRVLTDGIPLTEPDGRTSLDFIDLGNTHQIEVLRSNGSVLYGNASGGVLNLRSSLDFEQPYFDFHGQAGSFGYHREQGVGGFQVGRANGTLSVYTSDFDGWRDHSESSTSSIQGRFGTPLSDDTDVRLLLDFVSNLNRYPGPLTETQLAENPEQANATFVARDERRFNRVGRVGVALNHEVTDKQQLSVSTWVEPKALQRSERNRFRDFARYHVGGNVLYQLQTPMGSGLQGIWSAGADEQFQDGSIQFYNLNPDGSRGTTLISNKREAANSAGGFVQGELRWTAGWSLRLAARYDNLWYISEDRIDPSLNASRKFTQVTPKGSIARYFDKHTLYASVGGGVEAPAFNEIDPPPPYDTLTSFNPFLDPMKSTSYEIGAKGLLTSENARYGKIGYDVALYLIDVENDIIPFNGGAYFFTAGKSRRRGLELGLDWTPGVVTVGTAVTFSNNEYEEYVNDLGDFSGKEVAGLPELFADLEVRWRIMPGLSVAGNMKHVGSYFADDANTAEAEAYDILGAEVAYERPTPFGMLRAFIGGNNLADEDYVASVFINGINGQYYEPGLPQNFFGGISFTLR